MNILTVISCAVIMIAGGFSITQYIHMLQQNSYFNSRYFKWLIASAPTKIILNAVLFITFTVLFIFHLDVAVLVLSVLYASCSAFFCMMKQKKAIKPLVFTARVKRMYVTYAVICVVLTVIASLLNQYTYIGLYLIATLPSVFAMVLIVVNSPIETMIRRWYISDAKKKLKSNSGMKVIGITGSYGKTSTKYILAKILQEKYNVLFTPGSFNTPLGVVRTVREMLKPAHEIFICEMGAKNVGDIEEICNIVHPDAGIITSVGPQHLETFKSIENVAKTKFELADAVKAKNGTVYLNMDNAYICERADAYQYVGYGTQKWDVSVNNIRGSRFGTAFDVTYRGETISLVTKLLGRHNVINIAGAVAVALDLGVSDKQIKFAVDHLTAVEHRLELKSFIKGSLLIDDAYNANPSGSREALNVLDSFEGYRKILVTPGMVELGSAEYDENYKLGKSAAEKGFEIVLVGVERSVPLSDGIKSVNGYDIEKMHVVSSFKEAMKLLNTMVEDHCVVLFENDLPDNYAK